MEKNEKLGGHEELIYTIFCVPHRTKAQTGVVIEHRKDCVKALAHAQTKAHKQIHLVR